MRRPVGVEGEDGVSERWCVWRCGAGAADEEWAFTSGYGRSGSQESGKKRQACGPGSTHVHAEFLLTPQGYFLCVQIEPVGGRSHFHMKAFAHEVLQVGVFWQNPPHPHLRRS